MSQPSSPSYRVGVLTALLLIATTLFLVATTLPTWALILSASLTLLSVGYVVGIYVLQASYDRFVARHAALPGWVAVPVVQTTGVALLLALTVGVRPSRWLSLSLVAFGLSTLVPTLRGDGYYERLFHERYPLPVWLVFLVAGILTITVAFHATRQLSALGIVLLVTLVAVFFTAVGIVPLALLHERRERGQQPALPPYPDVSVLIPAYNEEGYVGRCIESVLASAYPTDHLEIVVVDDGSTDGTYEEACSYREQGVKAFTKENGGKCTALNYGLLCANHDVIVAVDGDSELARDALSKIVGVLQHDPDVGAVAGTVKVANGGSVLTGSQALEYVLSISTFRRAFALFGAVPVVPGCLGAYRREVLEADYGFDPDTLTEDFDMTIRVLKDGWKVAASDAVVWTEAPETWRDLYRQRSRWSRGNLMTLHKHADVIVGTEYGVLHQFTFPLGLLTIVVVPFADLAVAVAIVLGIVAGHWLVIAKLFCLFVLFQGAIALLVVTLEDDDVRLIAFAPLFVVGYKHFVNLVTIKSIFDVLLRSDHQWTHVRRRRQDRTTPRSES